MTSTHIDDQTTQRINESQDTAVALRIGSKRTEPLSVAAGDFFPGRAMAVLAPGSTSATPASTAIDIAQCLDALGRIPSGIKCVMCVDIAKPVKIEFGKDLLKDNHNILYSYDESTPSLVPKNEFKITGSFKRDSEPSALYYMGEMTKELEKRYAQELMMHSYGNAYAHVQTALKALGACSQITLSMKASYDTEQVALEALSFGEISAMIDEVEKSAGLPALREYLPGSVRLEEKRAVAECYREQVENTTRLHEDFVRIVRGIATIWSRKLIESGLCISLDYNELEAGCNVYRNLQKHGYMIGIDQDVRALLAGVPLQDILV